MVYITLAWCKSNECGGKTAGGGDEGPAPVVVDDALGATDPERLSRMNLLFDQVGTKTQVLVLTCFPQRFDRVNAARRYSMAELKAPQAR